jgi:hypothetical protein
MISNQVNPDQFNLKLHNSLIQRESTSHLIGNLKPYEKNLELKFILIERIEAIKIKSG